MPQQIQPYGTNPYAEEALRVAEQGRGIEGMSRLLLLLDLIFKTVAECLSLTSILSRLIISG